MHYRKRPVTIEAQQWTSAEQANHIIDWIESFGEEYEGTVQWDEETGGPLNADGEDWGLFTIDTLEGTMTVAPGDFVIRGVAGEVYPCKPDVFEQTYEKV